jgi:hypothetical protein
MGGGGGDIGAKLDQILQALQGGGAQSGMNVGGQIKPKIDVNVEIMKLNKMTARIADSLGVHIPASEMVATPGDLTQMAAKQTQGGQQDAAMAGGISPMQTMPGMEAGPGKVGSDDGYAGLQETMNKAAYIISLRKSRRHT